MKRFAIATLATLTAIAPFATTAAYADPPQRHDNGRADNNRGDRNNNRNDNRRWDSSRDNGYTYNGRWNYGPPPAAYQGRPGFQAGYHAWRRGDRLPTYYRQQFRQVDWQRAHYRAPPRGYHYVRDDRGEVLLVGLATGVILSILANQ